MKNKPNRWRIIDFVTPSGAVRRAASSVVRTVAAVKDSAKTMGENLPGQQDTPDYPEDDLRNIVNARERFEAMYEAGQWSQADLVLQTRAVRRTKITALCMSVFALAGVVVLATTVDVWIAIFLIPASGSLLILGFSQAFRYALMETQISLRELISAREFVARNDFWLRFFG